MGLHAIRDVRLREGVMVCKAWRQRIAPQMLESTVMTEQLLLEAIGMAEQVAVQSASFACKEFES